MRRKGAGGLLSVQHLGRACRAWGRRRPLGGAGGPGLGEPGAERRRPGAPATPTAAAAQLHRSGKTETWGGTRTPRPRTDWFIGAIGLQGHFSNIWK